MRNVSSVVLTNTIIIKWSLYSVLLLSLGLRRLFTAFHPKEKFINTSEKLNLEKVMLFRRWLCLKVERIYLHHVLELTFQSDFFFFLYNYIECLFGLYLKCIPLSVVPRRVDCLVPQGNKRFTRSNYLIQIAEQHVICKCKLNYWLSK